jgi:hypothetical protein
MLNPRAYSRAFTIAGIEHHRRQHGEFGAWMSILAEGWLIYQVKLRRRVARFAGNR